MILDLVARLKAEGRVSIIMILHNYVHVLQACDRVSMIQDGVITLDKPTNGPPSRSSRRSSSTSTGVRESRSAAKGKLRDSSAGCARS